MSETKTKSGKNEDFSDECAIDGEIVAGVGAEVVENTEDRSVYPDRPIGGELVGEIERGVDSRAYAQYLLVPILFLLVALLGGLRITADGGELLFLRPALVCLVFAVALMLLFFRAGLLTVEGWFSEKFTPLENAANAGVIISLFFASTQIFNSLIPEQGLAFWVIGFCFFWTLWNYLFADFETRRLLKSLIGMFSLAFIVKYLVLNNFVSEEEGSWLSRLWNDPTKEAVSYLLNIPRFAAATGYIQFFTLIFYVLGLYLLPPVSHRDN